MIQSESESLDGSSDISSASLLSTKAISLARLRRMFDMTETSQNDVIGVGGGSGGCGEGVGTRSSTPAVAAGFAADAGCGVANGNEKESEGGLGLRE